MWGEGCETVSKGIYKIKIGFFTMDFNLLKARIINLELGKREDIYFPAKDVVVFVNKPLKVPTQLKNSKRYDPQQNFQIGIAKAGYNEFLPNHLRILMDLNLKNQEDSKKAEILFDAIQAVYDGEDPQKFEKQLKSLHFDRQIEASYTDLCLTQLFMLEQDVNYTFGKIQPPRSYLMGYIRMVQLKAEEIDKLLWSSTRHPPRIIYRTH